MRFSQGEVNSAVALIIGFVLFYILIPWLVSPSKPEPVSIERQDEYLRMQEAGLVPDESMLYDSYRGR